VQEQNLCEHLGVGFTNMAPSESCKTVASMQQNKTTHG